ncbi:hypothetical protein [Halobacterium jilantaiense]|uniref:Secreted glycoprotein n=1 Tax=Halobacterium jilantaiense TaxID=355548 RepID=A0A1I0QLD7_9EURY|nr:hypothetical protein [Halobacterium jilantaiense]SEW27910.1 hypothetical protein SAMN04487945_2708 [Halobacterium jilantaiense]
MRFRDDTRGVTVQVGAVLLFATIIIALSVYQATVVPAENADVEYRHSQQVQGQLVDVRNALVSTAETGNARPATVSLGTEYPNRVFLVNPPPAAGTLRTDTYDDPRIEVSNVNATNNETRQYLDGSWAQPTKALSFVPGYNEYRNAPRLRYEASLLSNYYPEQNTSVPLTDQLLVDEQTRTVSLVALNGSLGTSRSSSVAVNPSALSAPAQRVQVQPETPGQPVNVTIPTVVNASVLRNSTSLGDNPNVTVTQNGTDRVTLSIDWSGPFTLRTAKVGVGSDATNPPPHYLTLVESDDDSVTVEARDEYNNPVSGTRVNTSEPSVFDDDDGEKRTNEDGRVTFDVDGDQPETEVTFGLVNGEGTFKQRTVNETVGSSSASVNGSGGAVVYLNDSRSFDGQDGGDTTGGFNFTVRNDHASQVNLTDVTVLPEDDEIDGLSDAATSEGRRQSELYANTTEENVTVDVPTGTGEYGYVGSRGLTLSVEESRTERTAIGDDFSTSETTVLNAGLGISSGETATIEVGEFYRGVTTDTPEAVNVTDENFRVAVSYERDGVRETDSFVVYPSASSGDDEGGGGGGSAPSATITETSNRGSSGQFGVSYSATANGDGDLERVSVEAAPLFSGPTLTASRGVSGESATGSFRLRGAPDIVYVVTVTVRDADGNTGSDTVFHVT